MDDHKERSVMRLVDAPTRFPFFTETGGAPGALSGGAAADAGVLSTESVWLDVSGRLRRFIAARIRNRDDAEDVLQDVFVKIHDRLPHLEDPGRLHAWVYQITRNTIMDYYRRRGRTPELTTEFPEDLAAEQEEADLTDEVAAWLLPMIETLPAKYRDALRLSEVQGLTQRETADLLGISLSGAKSRVQRGRERLRAALVSCCHVELDRAGRVVEWRSRRPKVQPEAAGAAEITTREECCGN
jgi:RNA polymerase sigma-70 factor, ECF subfamily